MATCRVELNFRIIGKPWTLRCLDKRTYNKKKSRANSLAVTYNHKRRIVLSPSGMDMETLVHELVHAYLYELCTHSADLTTDAQEEIFCELLSKRGRELLDLAETLHARVTKALAGA